MRKYRVTLWPATEDGLGFKKGKAFTTTVQAQDKFLAISVARQQLNEPELNEAEFVVYSTVFVKKGK